MDNIEPIELLCADSDKNENFRRKKGISNNWTPKNTATVKNWRISLAEASFIYQTILEKYKKRLDRTLVIILILGTVGTILSAISSTLLTMKNVDYIFISLAINIIIFLTSGIITVLNGSIKIYKWDEFIVRISAYIEKLDSFHSIIATELILPDQLRDNAVDFIKKSDNDYLNIIQQSPDLFPSDIKWAKELYKKFLTDNSISFKCAKKYYESDDNTIDIV